MLIFQAICLLFPPLVGLGLYRRLRRKQQFSLLTNLSVYAFFVIAVNSALLGAFTELKGIDNFDFSARGTYKYALVALALSLLIAWFTYAIGSRFTCKIHKSKANKQLKK